VAAAAAAAKVAAQATAVDPLERCAQLIQQRRTTTYLQVKKVLVSEYGEHEFVRVKAYITEMLANEEEARAFDGGNGPSLIGLVEPEPQGEARGGGGGVRCKKCDAVLSYADVGSHECPAPAEEMLPEDQWVPNESVKACQACGKVFGSLTRKHHCRCCGRIFCSGCSSQKHDFANPWQWQASGTRWELYGLEEQRLLNRALLASSRSSRSSVAGAEQQGVDQGGGGGGGAAGSSVVTIQRGGFTYAVDVQQRVQLNQQSGRRRAVRGGGGTTSERVCAGCHAALSSGRGVVVAQNAWRRGARWEVGVSRSALCPPLPALRAPSSSVSFSERSCF
jgi:hypothetical protein